MTTPAIFMDGKLQMGMQIRGGPWKTIPLATREAVETGKLHKGDIVLFAAVGAGFTVGTNLWRWAY